jgi:hypothetical protein
MHQPEGLDRKGLQAQLQNYKLIVDIYADLQDQSLFAKEDLPKKLELAQSYLNESDEWGKRGDPTKSYDALSDANLIILEITAVLKYILYQDTRLDDGDSQSRQISE